LLENQAKKFKPEICAVYEEKNADNLKIKLKDTNIKVLSGMNGINFISSHEKTDYVINALMGQIGLEPTLKALYAKKTVGLANKEPLVAAGDIVMKAAREFGSIIPIDSEHCAIYQCLRGEEENEIDKLILTASGGPFYGKTVSASIRCTDYRATLRKPNTLPPTSRYPSNWTSEPIRCYVRQRQLIELCRQIQRFSPIDGLKSRIRQSASSQIDTLDLRELLFCVDRLKRKSAKQNTK